MNPWNIEWIKVLLATFICFSIEQNQNPRTLRNILNWIPRKGCWYVHSLYAQLLSGKNHRIMIIVWSLRHLYTYLVGYRRSFHSTHHFPDKEQHSDLQAQSHLCSCTELCQLLCNQWVQCQGHLELAVDTHNWFLKETIATPVLTFVLGSYFHVIPTCD